VDYRRAPEHRHPAALEDALDTYRWLLASADSINADPTRIALIGESSGATTVACLSLLLRDLSAQLPMRQVLAYPIADASGRWPSYEEHGHGYTLDAEFVRWTVRHYVPAGHNMADRYLMPLSAPDLAGLPPTLIVTAEFDPLRDEGLAYAQKLTGAGVTVEHLHADDQMHGFLLLDRAVARAGDLIDQLADSLAGRGVY